MPGLKMESRSADRRGADEPGGDRRNRNRSTEFLSASTAERSRSAGRAFHVFPASDDQSPSTVGWDRRLGQRHSAPAFHSVRLERGADRLGRVGELKGACRQDGAVVRRLLTDGQERDLIEADPTVPVVESPAVPHGRQRVGRPGTPCPRVRLPP